MISIRLVLLIYAVGILLYYLSSNIEEKKRSKEASCTETTLKAHTKKGWTTVYDCGGSK